MSMPGVQELQGIAERIVGAVSWREPGVGYCRCPGGAAHQNPNGRRDCRVSVVPGRAADGTWVEAPTITCFHASCADIVRAANHTLRSEIGKAKARLGGGAPPGRRPEAAPAMTQGAVSRTPRTPLFDVVPAGERSRPESRTLRTDFFPSHTDTRTGQNTLEKQGGAEIASAASVVRNEQPSAEIPSAVSGPPEDAEEPGFRWGPELKIKRTRDRLPPGCVYVNAKGTVFQARRTADAIEVGRMIVRPKVLKGSAQEEKQLRS